MFNKIAKVSQMTKSSIDTFDPQGLLIREEPITSLKDGDRPTILHSNYRQTNSNDAGMDERDKES